MLRAKYNICTIVDALDFAKLRVGLGIFVALLLWPAVNFAEVAISYSGDAVASKGLAGGTAFKVDHLALPSTGAGGSFTGTSTGSKPFAGLVCHNCGDRERTFLSVQGSGLSSLTETAVDSVVLHIGGHSILVHGLSNATSAICPTVLGERAQVNWNAYVGSVSIDPASPTLSFLASGIMDSQTFPLGKGAIDGTVKVNRVASKSEIAAGADIVVNSIQVDMATGDQVVIGSSHAGVMCPSAPEVGAGGCPGKVTGGGGFLLKGKRQTFGFVAGIKKDGTAFGNFNYINHGTSEHLQGDVQRVSIDSNTAMITGNLKSAGPYALVVVDSPKGQADSFSLISEPLNTGTTPIALDPRGGNIQLHKGCGKK
jgi:hypothetical protein